MSQSLAGRPAPAIKLKSMRNRSVDLDFGEQGIVILDFWAVKCGPCLVALPKLQELYEWAKRHKKPVAVYCINYKDSLEDASNVWQDKGFTMPVLMDAEGLVAKSYGVNHLPSVFVIHGGKIVAGPDMSYRRRKLIVDSLLQRQLKETRP